MWFSKMNTLLVIIGASCWSSVQLPSEIYFLCHIQWLDSSLTRVMVRKQSEELFHYMQLLEEEAAFSGHHLDR